MLKLYVTLIIAAPTICYMQMIYVLLHQVHVAFSLCWICTTYGFENDILYNPAK